MNKLDNFAPLFIISLPDQKKRINNLKQEFRQYNIKKYKVIPAVDGRKNDLREIVYGEYPKLRPQEIGCVASHLKALQEWIETSDSEYAIIMEDDCSLYTVQFWQWDWNYFMKNIPKDADIVQLVMIKNNNVKFNMHVKESYASTPTTTYAWSTACYVIKRSYAKKILDMMVVEDKIDFSNVRFKNKAADVLLYNLGKAYSMPILTYFLDTKNAINNQHADFHIKSKQHIDSWWENHASYYPKESFFDVRGGLQKRKLKKTDLVFNIFHVDGDTDVLKKRTILTKRATNQLLPDFAQIETPTILIKDYDDVKSFFKNESIVIDPKGYKDTGWKFGELGVWASNYSAWKNFAETDHEMLMLMEDDIVLSKHFNIKLKQYIEELPDDWDFFTVYIPTFGNVKYKVGRKDLDIGKENICKVYQSWSCLCYIVSKRGAKKLLNLVKEPVKAPIDHWLFYHEKLNGYAIKVEKGNICDIYKLKSTIQSAEKHDMTGYV